MTSLDELPIMDNVSNDRDVSNDSTDIVSENKDDYDYREELDRRDDPRDGSDPRDQYRADTGIIEMLIDKLKEPALVTVIMLVLTNPIFIKMLLQLPYLEVYSNSQSINIGLSILAGCVFFVIKEFILTAPQCSTKKK